MITLLEAGQKWAAFLCLFPLKFEGFLTVKSASA